jgi:asparagine synthase (glutamine-hydrolysing)
MCGILGRIAAAPIDDATWAMAQSRQAHRGPDGQGQWHGACGAQYISLAHQRLAVIDLSECGAQPMVHTRTGSVLVYNGEIYNYVELRRELEECGVIFRGDSDTEVLLNALEVWGAADALPRLNGMWAFAWLDARARRLTLSRDRCGEKPLYVATDADGLVFASELKAVLCLRRQRSDLNDGPVLDFLALGLLDTSTETMINGVCQVGPGTFVSYNLSDRTLAFGEERRYWSASTSIPECADSLGGYVERVQEVLEDSVRIRLRSDVPVGVLLSGGIDSSAIAAAAATAGADLTLYSLRNDDSRIDESPYARAVARQLALPVSWLTMPANREGLMQDVEAATWASDAPLAGFSCVALFRIMRMAREAGVTVLLSGQGGDELFCGYRKYLGFHLADLLRRGRWLELAQQATPWLRNGTLIPQWSTTEATRYLPRFLQAQTSSLFGERLSGLLPSFVGLARGQSLQDRQIADLTQLSVPTLVHYEDRLSMAWAREVRLPFLDHRLIDLAVPAPIEFKLGPGWSKYALRKAIEPWLPHEVVWRRVKQGFSTPEAGWMRGELQEAIREYLPASAEVFRRELVDQQAFFALNARMCAPGGKGRRVWGRDVFRVLALEVWLQRFGGSIMAA